MIREQLISARQAKAWRAKADKFNAWLGDRCSYKPSDVPRLLRMTNEQRGKLEQFEVWRDKPARLFAYVRIDDYSGKRRTARGVRPHDKASVTVWTGEPLGFGHVGNVWRSNFGDRRASVCVVIAGVTYSGTAYIDAGDYCRLRRVND